MTTIAHATKPKDDRKWCNACMDSGTDINGDKPKKCKACGGKGWTK